MSFDFGTNSSKMIAIAAAVIAISLFDFSCKKNDSSSPSNPSVIITGDIKNNITGSRTIAEVNDDIHVNATGNADPLKTQGFDIFRVWLYNGNERVEPLQLIGSLNPGHGIEYVINLSGDDKLLRGLENRTLDIRVEYSMANDGEMKYQTIGTMKINAEKDYIYDSSYNQKIYDNRVAIAKILDRNARFNGEDQTYDYLLKVLEFAYNPDKPKINTTMLEDTSPGNNFTMLSNNRTVFSGLTEQDLYEIRNIIEL